MLYNKEFHKMDIVDGSYFINAKKPFQPHFELDKQYIDEAFCHASCMVSGKGEHRNKRSGGNSVRTNREIFANALQGKMAEYVVYSMLKNKDINVTQVDISEYPLGIWDEYDLKANQKTISVKSTKPFGNLLLLETKDYNKNGEYIPNINTKSHGIFEHIVFVRVDKYAEELPNIGICNFKSLRLMAQNHRWIYDIPGFITHEDLQQLNYPASSALKPGFLQGACVPGGTPLGWKTR